MRKGKFFLKFVFSAPREREAGERGVSLETATQRDGILQNPRASTFVRNFDYDSFLLIKKTFILSSGASRRQLDSDRGEAARGRYVVEQSQERGGRDRPDRGDTNEVGDESQCQFSQIWFSF